MFYERLVANMAEYGEQTVIADVNSGNMLFIPGLPEGIFQFDCSEKDKDAAYPSLSFVGCKVRDTAIAVHKVPEYFTSFECVGGKNDTYLD